MTLTNVPKLIKQHSSVAEREETEPVHRALNALQGKARNFRYALSLFDYCVSHEIPITEENAMTAATVENLQWFHWKRIACREGAFVLYDFWHTLAGLKETIKGCALISDKVDRACVKHADALFRGRFPHWEDIRNAVGHTGQTSTTQAQLDENSLKGPLTTQHFSLADGATAFIEASLVGRTFGTTTFGGQHLTYEMSEESLVRLWTICGAMFEALCGEVAGQNAQDRSVASGKYLREINGD